MPTEADSLPKFQLPISRVRKICKMDPELGSISTEGVQAITLATEKFVHMLATASYNYAKEDSRKTIQMKDINHCIQRDWVFALLEDAITDWPEPGMARQATVATTQPTMASVIEEENEEEEAVDGEEGEEEQTLDLDLEMEEEEVLSSVGSEESNTNQAEARDMEDLL